MHVSMARPIGNNGRHKLGDGHSEDLVKWPATCESAITMCSLRALQNRMANVAITYASNNSTSLVKKWNTTDALSK